MDLEQRKSYDVIISDYKHRIFKAYEGDTPDMIRFRATLETMKQPDMYEVDKQAKAIRPQGGNNWYDYAGDAIKGFGESIGTIPGRVAMQAARGTMDLSTNFALTGQKLLNYGEMAAYGFASLFANADPEIKAQEKKLQELSGLSKAYGQVSDDLNKQINASLGGNESIGTEIIDGIASVAPGFLISGGGSMFAKGADVVSRVAAGSRALAFAYGMSGANEVASDLESRGVSRGKAFLTGLGAAPLIGYVNTLGDKLPLRTILAKGAERMGLVTVAKKMIQNGLGEGVEESADYATRKATQFLNGVNEESWLEIGQNFLKTFAMAALVGNVIEGGAIAFNQAGFVADTKKRLIDAGMTEERADLQIADWIEATQSDKFRQDLTGMNQILSSPELKEFQEQTLSQQRQAIISGLNGVLMQAEVIDMGHPTIDDPTRTPPVLPESYTLDGETVSTVDNPILGMMLYQMEQEGKPITSLREALRVVDEKVGLSETVKTAASIAQVYGQATQDLRIAGFSEEEIDSTARSQTAMAYSLARTLGVSVEEAYATFPKIQRSNSAEVRQIKPLAEADIDLLKIAKNPALYKRLEQQEKEQRGLSLLPFLKQRGGLKDTGGELKSMDAGKSYIGLINNKNGQELDNMALSAWENGYFPMHSERPTVDELLQAIDDELRGNKHYAHNQNVFGSKLEAVNGLIENMNQLNVDYENVSAEDALKAYNEAVGVYNSGNYQKNGISWNYDESGNLYGTTADGKTIIDGEVVPFQEQLDLVKEMNVIDTHNEAYEGETININGVDRTVYNSEGKRIAKSEPALKAFYNWFGDSKVVDEQGRPLVVYHGTNADFDVFKGTKILNSSEGIGFNFAVKKDIAEGFGNVISVYIKLENPVYAYSNIDLVSDTYESDFENENQEAIREAVYKVKENLIQKGYTFYDEVDVDLLDLYAERSQAQEVLDGLLDLGSYIQEDYDAETLYNDIRQAEIDAFGIDGYVTKNYGANGGAVYVAFTPNQIKSVNNRGTFSRTSYNIYYQWQKDINKEDSIIYRTDKSRYLTDNEVKQVLEDSKRFIEKVEKLENGSLKNREQIVVLTKLPSAYDNIPELNGRRLFIPQEIYKKIVNIPNKYNKNHNVDRKRAIKLPELVADPNYILQSNSKGHEDRFVIVTNSRGKEWGTRLSVIIQANSRDVVVSAYDENIDISKEKKAGRVIYDKKKGLESGVSALNAKGPSNPNASIITQPDSDVNTQPSQNNIYYQGQISDNGQGVELTINSQEEMQGLSDEEFKNKMLETLKSFKGNKIFNQSLNGDIEIRTSSIKKYKSFFADKNKRLIVPYIPKLLEKAKFREIEKSYMQGKESNIKAYYKANIGITIDNNDYNVRLTVREDNQGNFFWDARIKEGSQHATPATNPGDTAPIDLIILQPDLNVNPLLQKGGTPNGAYDSGANIIYLFETANRSTFLHEMSHFYMNQILQAANAGSERAQAIKQALDKWLRKNGNESYSLADWERFARGFEQYLREGKAPNNYMKRAFDAFKQWLSSVYAALRGQRLGVINEVGNVEPVRMNDEIRSLYADMLGGKNIDEVLDKADSIRKQEQALREMHEQQERMAQERASMIDRMAETLPPNEGSAKSWLNNLRTDYKKSNILKDIFTSLTTRAKNIDPAIALRMREFVKSEYDLTNHFAVQVQPLMTKLRAMSAQDQQLFDFYAKNAHESGIDRLAGKYGFTQELEGYRQAMDEIYHMAAETGIEMNYREVYYPRRVKDKVAFLEYINNKDAGLISQMNDEIGISASMDEKAEWLNAHLQSFHIEHFPKLPGNTKERTIDIIDPDLNRFYEHIFDSIANYIDGMAKAINMRRVWGRGADAQDGQMTKIGLEQTIGEVIARGVEKGTITTNAQMDEVRRILTAFLGDHGHQSQLLARIKGSSYATMLTRGTATLSQIGDFGTSIWNNGLVNTIKALMPNEDININELGIEKLTEEFRNPEAMAKQINWLYKISGFNDVDIYMKNVYLRGRWAKLKEMKTADLEAYLRPMFENRTDDLIKDIKSGNVSDDVKLLLFSELSEVQPTSKAELPYAYAVNPNGRALYMMKTFMIRRMDFILQKTRGEWKKGNKAQAVKNLATLALVVGGFEALANLIKDIVRGKEVNLTDNVIDGILGMFMLNQYIMYRFRSGGVTDAAASLVIPPVFPALQTLLFRDLPKVLAGKRDIKDMEFWSYITALGNFYYWYFGGGLKKKDKTRGASGTIRF